MACLSVINVVLVVLAMSQVVLLISVMGTSDMTGQVLVWLMVSVVVAVLNGRAKVTKICLREFILLEVGFYCAAHSDNGC